MTVLHSDGADQTRRLGEELGKTLIAGDVVLLHGDLGAGKTTFTQGLLRGLDVRDQGRSPTFILVAEHEGTDAHGRSVVVRHADLYRLTHPEELESFGYEELLADLDGILIVEWPERAGTLLPERYLLVQFEFAGPDSRRIEMRRIGDSPSQAAGAISGSGGSLQ